MVPSSEPTDLISLLSSARAVVEYQREMGLDELLIGWDDPSPAPAAVSAEAREVAVEPGPSPAERLAELEAELAGCTRCPLHQKRNSIVFGVGDPQARLVFVGEGPGADEDRLGEPFVGAAGQLLDRIIGAIGLDRQKVYICNIVKCRPPRNRTPLPPERATCGPFLERQLAIVQPEVIVALGRTAANDLLDNEISMGRLRGRFYPRGDALVMPTFHPAYLLRTPEAKRAVWEDMKKVRDRLGLLT